MSNREIDALVATKVMGYRRLEFTRENGSQFIMMGPPMWFKTMLERYPERLPHEVFTGDEGNAPEYTTDPAATDSVIERVRDTLPGFRRFEVHCLPDGFVSQIEVGTSEVDEHYAADAEASSRGCAVCISALKAFGVEVSE